MTSDELYKQYKMILDQGDNVPHDLINSALVKTQWSAYYFFALIIQRLVKDNDVSLEKIEKLLLTCAFRADTADTTGCWLQCNDEVVKICIFYAIEVLGKQWPLFEQNLLQLKYATYLMAMYATSVMSHRWPELEDEKMNKYYSPHFFSYFKKYHDSIIQDANCPFYDYIMCELAKSPKRAMEYAVFTNKRLSLTMEKQVTYNFKKSLDTMSKLSIIDNFDALISYMQSYKTERWTELEMCFAQSSYARPRYIDFLKMHYDELEVMDFILQQC